MSDAISGDRKPDQASGRTDGSPSPGVQAAAQNAFAELAAISLDALSLGQVLQRVAELAQHTLLGAHEVSVTLIEGTSARSVAFTGDLAVILDERQYSRGFGPCMDAALAGQTIYLTDLAADTRYPDFSGLAVRAGVLSSLSVGMPAPQRVAGGLNFYSRTTGGFDDAAIAAATAFAEYASVAMINAALVDSKTTLARQLERAMTSRAVIEQAKGILIARLHCTPDEAFAHLARQSQRSNRKVHDLAASIVTDAQRGHA